MELKRRRLIVGLTALIVIVGLVVGICIHSPQQQGLMSGLTFPWIKQPDKEDELPVDFSELTTIHEVMNSEEIIDESGATVNNTDEDQNGDAQNSEINNSPTPTSGNESSGVQLHDNELPLDMVK